MKSFPCPHCGAAIPASLALSRIGSLGGKSGRGAAKVRSSAHCSLAGKRGAEARWGKRKTV